MRELTLDIGECYSPEEIHDVIAGEFPLPEYYGGNLDALYDMLTEVGQPTSILFCGCKAAASVVGAKYMKKLRRVCKDAASENDNLKIVFEDLEDYYS